VQVAHGPIAVAASSHFIPHGPRFALSKQRVNPKPTAPFDDEPTVQEDPTEPFVRVADHMHSGPRYLSSPWSTIPDRPLIFTPQPEDVDFEAAIESLTETQPVDWEDLVAWDD
jgi:hypothetical protein